MEVQAVKSVVDGVVVEMQAVKLVADMAVTPGRVATPGA